jgi:integrase
VAVKPVSYKTKVGEQRVKTGKLGWKLRPTVNGMQITRTFFGTYEEAVVEISLIIASASKATKVSATRAVTVEKYMVEWVQGAKYKIPPSNGNPGVEVEWSTWRKWYDSTFRIIETLGTMKLKNVKYTDCLSAIAGMQRKDGSGSLKPNSKSTIASTMRIAFKHAVRDGFIPYNPASELPTSWAGPGDTTRRVDIPSLIQLEAQAEALEPEFGDVVRVLGYSGLRISELVGLSVADVNFEQRTIYVHSVITFAGGRKIEKKPKTMSSIRLVPILDQAIKPLERLIARSQERNSHYVVSGIRGNSMAMSTWNRCLRAARESKTLSIFPAHAFRHTYASVLLAKGVNLQTVSSALGHSNGKVTMNIYRHVLPLSQAALAKRLSSAVTELVAEEAVDSQ